MHSFQPSHASRQFLSPPEMTSLYFFFVFFVYKLSLFSSTAPWPVLSCIRHPCSQWQDPNLMRLRIEFPTINPKWQSLSKDRIHRDFSTPTFWKDGHHLNVRGKAGGRRTDFRRTLPYSPVWWMEPLVQPEVGLPVSNFYMCQVNSKEIQV